MATLYSAQWHRAHAAYLRTLPGPKAQRAAEQAEVVARLIEKRDRRTYAKQQIAEKLALARQNAEYYTALADNPQMSPAAALAARNLARSYKAATALYEGALAYESQRRPNAGAGTPELRTFSTSAGVDSVGGRLGGRGEGTTGTRWSATRTGIDGPRRRARRLCRPAHTARCRAVATRRIHRGAGCRWRALIVEGSPRNRVF
jgi:hypothetical protein